MSNRLRSGIACMVCILCLTACVAGGAETMRFSMAGFDGEGSSHQWETNAYFSRMETRTGIHFSFEEYTQAVQWQAAKDNMFASGPLPDVLFKAALTTPELIRYTDSGQLVDLKPLLEENAPHLWALLAANPTWLEAITLPNGAIGALPFIQPMPLQNAMWINQAWLDRLGLTLPSDAQGLAETLRAFQTGDPNQNGKQDEVPLTFLGVWDLKFLSHAFGQAVNDYNIYMGGDGAVHYWPLEDSFVALLRYLRGLYSEKLLDQNGFYTVDALRMVSDSKAEAAYGVFFGPNPLSLMGYEQAKEYVLLPPLAHEGQQVYRDLGAMVIRGTFAITSACADPAALLHWADILYTQEGAIEALAGIRGIDYVVDAQGRWQWAGGQENTDMDTLNSLSIFSTGSMPGIFPQAFYGRFADDQAHRINQECEKLQSFVVMPFANHALTVEQSEGLLPLQNELGKYVDEAFARFVLGQWNLSREDIDLFHQGLTDRHAEQMVAFWQKIADQ